jgi:3-deoxy-manno-octulosonate cytidylyltransferase (CMP-KDO synthetase)
MTAASHQSGTDRIAEVVRGMEDGIIVNVQGDEPEIEPEVVDGLIAAMEDGAWDMATAATEFPLGADAGDPNLVKVVMGMDGRALYFSRSAIPFHRDVVLSGTDGASRSTGVSPVVMAANTGETPVLRTPPKTSAGGLAYYLHLGIYAYRRAFLLEFAAWAPTPLESAEKLEQLRVLEHGRPIFVLKVKRASHGIDTPGQYADFVRRHRAGAGPARARSELR